MLMHVAQLILRRSITLAGGLAIPDQSMDVVLGNAEAAKIVVRQSELRLRVPRGGGLAKRVELIVRRRCGRLGRGLYRCLRSRSRRGNQREHKESWHRGPSPNAHAGVSVRSHFVTSSFELML